MQSSSKSAASGSKRTRSQTRAAFAAAASTSSPTSGSTAAAAGQSASSSPQSAIDGAAAAKRQRRADGCATEDMDDAALQERPNTISPIARLDLDSHSSDSLSIVLSLLSSDDFLSAIRVNKQFYSARLKKTAWPALQIDAFIQSLLEDDYDNPARRRLRVHARKDRLPRFVAMLPPADGDGAPAALAANMWRLVTDAHLYSHFNGGGFGSGWPHGPPRPPVSPLLPQLARLPFLTSVNFHNVDVSADAFQQFIAATATRLKVLMFERCSSIGAATDPSKEIGLLRGLRVLVTDRMPDATSLVQLQQLEHLHLTPGWGAHLIPLATTIRYLSSSYALRSLSLGNNGGSQLLYMLCGTAPPQHIPAHFGPTALPNPTAALVDWKQPCDLTAVSLDGALEWRSAFILAAKALPVLVTLKVRLCKRVRWAPVLQPGAPETMLPQLDLFSRIHQLCLTIDESDLLEHIAHCKELRRLQLSAPYGIGASTAALCKIVEANADTLEELRLCHAGSRSPEIKSSWPSFATIIEADPNDPVDVAEMDRWSVLANCPRLRILELPIKNEVAPQLLSALADAPAFQALELGLWSRLHPQSSPLLQWALASSSWCTIRFHCAQPFHLRDAAELEELLPAAGAAPDLAPWPSSAALRRLRVFARRAAGTEHCFMLHPAAAGSFEWQQEY